MAHQPKLVVVIGPSGCGKSTIAERLAKKINGHYVEGDSFHPQCNIDKMSNGIPLEDQDRWPWLDSISDFCSKKALTNSQYIIVTCSALKKSYRDRLRNVPNIQQTIFVYLKGSRELIRKRLNERNNHFMKSSMLDSQFETLESPDAEDDVIIVDIELSIQEIIEKLSTFLLSK